MKSIFTVVIVTSLLSGCMTAAQHIEAVQDNSAEKVTVGTVQREIKVGMSGAEVAEVLGSPNIVSTDEQRREVWIYDKLATTSAHSSSSGGVSALVLGFGGSGGVGAVPGYSQGSGAASTSQKTLTIIIKFNKEGKVRDFSYRTSRF